MQVTPVPHVGQDTEALPTCGSRILAEVEAGPATVHGCEAKWLL